MAPGAKSGAPKGGGPKGGNKPKRPSKPSTFSSTAKPKKKTPSAKPIQQKTKSATKDGRKKKPPHMRYTEKELKVPELNGIKPAGVQKPPNAKKGKNFVDDKDSMNAILAMVMAEREGTIESKMMRARQLEEVREARKLEAEKRSQAKKEGFEDRKSEIKDNNKRKRRHTESDAPETDIAEPRPASKKPRKRVSFG